METIRPMGIKEFADKNKEHYELIKEAIKVYDEELFYLLTKICAVCDKKLNDEEISSVSPSHFQYTCEMHRGYATYFILDKIRMDLGNGIKVKQTIL